MSHTAVFTLIEGGLVFGVVAVWGLFELRGLRREARRREAREAQARLERGTAAARTPAQD